LNSSFYSAGAVTEGSDSFVTPESSLNELSEEEEEPQDDLSTIILDEKGIS
jgi:hypothetical protein